MACHSCKSKSPINNGVPNKEKSLPIRLLIFMLSLVVLTAITPILFVIGVYLLFNTVILNKATSVAPSISFINSIFNNKKIEEEDFDEELTDEEYELLNVEEIK